MTARIASGVILASLILSGCATTDAASRFKAMPTVPVADSNDDQDFSGDRHIPGLMPVETDESVSAPVAYDRIECLLLLEHALAWVSDCAGEILINNCSRGSDIRASECPACFQLNRADNALKRANCPIRPKFPPLREAN